MSGSELRQRLAAILAADVAGYSRLMAAGERATVLSLDAARSVFRSQIESNQGRVIDMAGDSVLAVFETATGAVSAAVAVQQELNTSSPAAPEDRRMRFRIGIHMGEVIEKTDGSVYGDGVNIAARLQELAEPGGITVSAAVQGSVRGKVPATFVGLGGQRLKNIAGPVDAFWIPVEGVSARRFTRRKILIGTLVVAVLGIGVGVYYARRPAPEERTTNPNLMVAEAERKEPALASSARDEAAVERKGPTLASSAPDRATVERAAALAERARIAAERAEAERLAADAKAAAASAKAAQAAAATELAGAPSASNQYQVAVNLEGEGKGKEAVRAYTQAARGGNCEAAKRLGDIYDKGLLGITRDYAESVKWYNAARVLGCDVPLQQRRG